MFHRDPNATILRLVATIIVAVLTVAGCDAIAEAEPDPTPDAAPEDAEPDVELGRDATPRDLAEALVALTDSCDAFAFEIGLFVDDVDAWEANFAEDGENAYRELDQDAMNACWVILTNGDFCEGFRSGDLAPMPDSPCNNLYPGILAEGDTCDFGECAAGFHCPYSDVCSVCTRSSLEGEPCVSECVTGLICSWDSGDPICAQPPPLIEEGDSCVEGERECEPFGLTCFEGVCTQRIAVAKGEQCDPGLIEGRRACSPADTFACFSIRYDAAPTCNKVPALGESCADSGYCDRAHCDTESSICVDYVPVGGECDRSGCIQGSYCEGGTCIEFQSFQCTE